MSGHLRKEGLLEPEFDARLEASGGNGPMNENRFPVQLPAELEAQAVADPVLEVGRSFH